MYKIDTSILTLILIGSPSWPPSLHVHFATNSASLELGSVPYISQPIKYADLPVRQNSAPIRVMHINRIFAALSSVCCQFNYCLQVIKCYSTSRKTLYCKFKLLLTLSKLNDAHDVVLLDLLVVPCYARHQRGKEQESEEEASFVCSSSS